MGPRGSGTLPRLSWQCPAPHSARLGLGLGLGVGGAPILPSQARGFLLAPSSSAPLLMPSCRTLLLRTCLPVLGLSGKVLVVGELQGWLL